MSVINENDNPINMIYNQNKENIKYKIDPKSKDEKPQIKVKLNQKKNNQRNVLSKLDINNNCLKQKKNISQPKKEKAPIKKLNIPKELKNQKIKSCRDIFKPNNIKTNDKTQFIQFSNPIPSEEVRKIIPKNLSTVQKTKLSPKNINYFIKFRESDNLLLNEGLNFYSYNKELESSTFKFSEKILQRHQITSAIRTKMVDWMIEVLSVFENMDETFFLSVNIMDLFFINSKKVLKNEDIHLIGITSMYIASKFQEIYPISLKSFVNKISHKQFNEKKIIKEEKIIMNDIQFESLVTTSVYDFIRELCYDFCLNNKDFLKCNTEKLIFVNLQKTAIYLAKLIMYYDIFYKEVFSVKAVACIITSMKIVKMYFKEKWNQNIKNIFNDWIILLLKQGKVDEKVVEKIGSKIYSCFNHYQKSNSLAKNLNKFTPLSFMKK